MMESYRETIQKIDRDMQQLFEKRIEVLLEIGAYKKDKALEVYDKAQETRKTDKLSGKFFREQQMLLKQEMAISRYLQHSLQEEKCFFRNLPVENPPKNEIIGVTREKYDFKAHENFVVFNKEADLLAAIGQGQVDTGIFYDLGIFEKRDIKTLKMLARKNMYTSTMEIKNRAAFAVRKQPPVFNLYDDLGILYVKGNTLEDFSVFQTILDTEKSVIAYEMDIMNDLEGKILIRTRYGATSQAVWETLLFALGNAMNTINLVFYGRQI